MKLQEFLRTQTKWGFEAVGKDADLTRQIQILLIGLGLLEPPADGIFGPITAAAIKKFQQLTKTGETDFIGAVTAEKLIETKPDDLPKPPLKLSNSIASRIVKYCWPKLSGIYQALKNTTLSI